MRRKVWADYGGECGEGSEVRHRIPGGFRDQLITLCRRCSLKSLAFGGQFPVIICSFIIIFLRGS